MIIDESTVTIKTNTFEEMLPFSQSAPSVFVAFESHVNDEKFIQPCPVLVTNGITRQREIEEMKKVFEQDCVAQYLKDGRFINGLS